MKEKFVKLLAKRFALDEAVFNVLSASTVTAWAMDVLAPNYSLSTQQHQWLIGEIRTF